MENTDHSANTIDQAEHILQQRLTLAGYTTSIKKNDQQRMDITVSNMQADDTSLVNELLTANSIVEFRELYLIDQLASSLALIDSIYRKRFNKQPSNTSQPPVPADTAADAQSDSMLKEFTPQPAVVPGTGMTMDGISSLIHFTTERYQSARGGSRYPATIGYVIIKDTTAVNQLFHDPEIIKILPADARLDYGPLYNDSPIKMDMLELYMVRTRGYEIPFLGNRDIANASAEFNSHGDPQIVLDFTDDGKRKWYNMTAQNIDRPLAIIFNGRVISAPYVESAIEGGSSLISGRFSSAEVKTFCAQLSTPPIPVIFTIEKKEISKKGVGNLYRNLLYACIVFIIATGTSLFIFKMLKNR